MIVETYQLSFLVFMCAFHAEISSVYGKSGKSFLSQDPEANIWAQEGCEWRRFHNEELHSLHRSLNIVRAIKSRRLRWASHVARMEELFSEY